MNHRRLEALADDALVREFVTTAGVLGAAVVDCETRQANRSARRLLAIGDVFRSRGPAARLKLAPLLDDPDRFVRYYAAKHLMAIVPDRARQVVEENARFGFDALAGDAGMMLHMIDSGKYKPM